jgi:hypothetical protein
MNSPCLITAAEDTYTARAERREKAVESAADYLESEYLAAAQFPLISTVTCPGSIRGTTMGRIAFLEAWSDALTDDRQLMARVVSILNRCDEGRTLLREMAGTYAEYWAQEMAEGQQ